MSSRALWGVCFCLVDLPNMDEIEAVPCPYCEMIFPRGWKFHRALEHLKRCRAAAKERGEGDDLPGGRRGR